MTEQQQPPAGEPGEGRGGFMGLGEPYVDFIPTFPMVKDPATGEWRNAQPGELPKPEQQPPNEDQTFKPTGGPDNQIPPGLEDEVAALEKTLGPDEVITITLPVDQNQPADPGLDNRLDPNAPYKPVNLQQTLDNRLDPNAPYKPVNLPEDETFEVTGGPDNQIPPGLEDEVAALEKTLGPDEVISIDLPVDQNQPADPGLPKFARDDLGQPPPGDSSEPPPPAPDPETVQALDPNLLNPLAPGPTLDTGLVGRIEGNPDLVNAVNQDSSVAEALEQDPTYLYQIEQHLGLAEQWSNDDPSFTDPSFTDPSFMDPGLTEQPLPDPSTPEEGADDLTL